MRPGVAKTNIAWIHAKAIGQRHAKARWTNAGRHPSTFPLRGVLTSSYRCRQRICSSGRYEP